VIYQHPLAYLLGLQGIALLRAFSGVYDRDFTIARLREIRALLDSVEELGDGVEARPIATREGYARWAAFYDEPGNQLIDLEQPLVREILDGLPPGVALDAACGTGRHTTYLASLGHKVIGVDTSPEMLLGGSLPLHLGAAPRALLAHEPKEFWEQYLLARTPLDAPTEKSPSTAEELMETLEQVLERGYSIANEDVVLGISSIGAPVFDYRGSLRAAISIAGPTPRILGDTRDENIRLVVDGGAQVSRALGYQAD